MAACLLNVRLALHPANVPIAHGRNVGCFCCGAALASSSSSSYLL
ncbi:MAG TPA: hypothetical protein VFH28_00065 [Nitrososphaera sp.]|nr:hypothetical protein [Nitrososphaera sp.]